MKENLRSCVFDANGLFMCQSGGDGSEGVLWLGLKDGGCVCCVSAMSFHFLLLCNFIFLPLVSGSVMRGSRFDSWLVLYFSSRVLAFYFMQAKIMLEEKMKENLVLPMVANSLCKNKKIKTV